MALATGWHDINNTPAIFFDDITKKTPFSYLATGGWSVDDGVLFYGTDYGGAGTHLCAWCPSGQDRACCACSTIIKSAFNVRVLVLS